MSWINSQQPYIVPTSEFYSQNGIFDPAFVNAFQPVECCPQPSSLYLSPPDYNQPFPQTLMNFAVPDFAQYIASEQPPLENEHENDNDDESDTSSEYSVPSPGDVPADSYFATIRAEMERGESVNALLQKQGIGMPKQEDDVAYCFSPSVEFDRSAQGPSMQATFASHPLYPTYVALNDLLQSTQGGITPDFACKAEPMMKIACNNLATMNDVQYPGDSVIRYQIGWLLDRLADTLMPADGKPDFSYNPEIASIDNSGPSYCEYTSVGVESVPYPVCTPGSIDADSESSSDDTVKEEYISSKSALKRKREDPVDEEDEDEDDTEEDADDDFSTKRPVPKDVQKKRRENYAPDISFELFSWWFDNDGAAPNAQAKQELASKTGKTISQIATWYQNAKRRYSARLEDFRALKAQRPHDVRDYGSYETYTRSQGSGSTTKRRRAQ